MGPKTKELVDTLEDLIQLLETLEFDGGNHWKEWMEDCKRRLCNSDFRGITHLLGAYGGMGSFNDFEMDNKELGELRTKAYVLAEYIRKNAEVG